MEQMREKYGVLIPCHPGSGEPFVSRVTFWRQVRGSMETVMRATPKSEKAFFSMVADCYAYAQRQVQEAEEVVERRSGQRYLFVDSGLR